jgi:hypothetical protein
MVTAKLAITSRDHELDFFELARKKLLLLMAP